MPSKLTDSHNLRTQAYRDASRLNARIALHERFSTNSYPWHSWVFDQIEFPAKARILEIGCGLGDFWEENRGRIPADASITLTDLSEGMLAEARGRLGHSLFHYGCVDAQRLPFPAASFDLIVAKHMLYHVPDRRQAYQEMTRVLKPGGKLYAATNGKEHMGELVTLVQAFGTNSEYTGVNLGFDLENGKADLGAWFDTVELRPYHDSLEVSEAAPLAAYIASMTFFSDETFQGKRLDALTQYLQSIIEHKGSIHITKSVGLFIAQTAAHLR